MKKTVCLVFSLGLCFNYVNADNYYWEPTESSDLFIMKSSISKNTNGGTVWVKWTNVPRVINPNHYITILYQADCKNFRIRTLQTAAYIDDMPVGVNYKAGSWHKPNMPGTQGYFIYPYLCD